MSEYRKAVKSLSKDERIVVAHLEELIGDMKAVRVANVFRGQEALIASKIEKEVMAHLMPNFLSEIQKERSKIDLLMNQMNEIRDLWIRERKALNKMVDDFQKKLEILGHIQALAKEGKVEIILPSGEREP